MGPGWLGFPSIVLGKEKGADRKMRFFQGIDSVTAMVRRGWGAVESRGEEGPGRREREAQRQSGDLGKAVDFREQAWLPHSPGFQAVALRTPEAWRQRRGERGDSRVRRKQVAQDAQPGLQEQGCHGAHIPMHPHNSLPTPHTLRAHGAGKTF